MDLNIRSPSTLINNFLVHIPQAAVAVPSLTHTCPAVIASHAGVSAHAGVTAIIKNLFYMKLLLLLLLLFFISKVAGIG